jgi:hypothetical protein
MRRLPTLIAVIVLALLFVWIADHTYWTQVVVPKTLQGEAASNPFYAAQRLAELLGAHAESSHQLFTAPAAEAVIVVSSWSWDLIPSRRDRLERWVQSGGRLVIDQSVFGAGHLEQWTGVRRDKEGNLVTDRKTAWSSQRRGTNKALRVRVGRGTVTVLDGRPFVQLNLLEPDQARLFVDSTQLRAGDRVYFLSDSTGASLLSLVWKHGAPAIVLALCVLALAMWRASVRFGPLEGKPDPGRRSLADQIRGTGRFTLRFGGGRALHAAEVRALNETADRHIARYGQLPSEERVATLARLAGLEAAELSQALNYSGPRRPGELRGALAVLEFAQRAISAAQTATKTSLEGTRHAG